MFEPVGGVLTCPYCGRIEKIPETAAEIRENSFEHYLKVHPDRLSLAPFAAKELECPSCNAVLELPAEAGTGDCPFCGTLMVIIERSPDPLVAPEALLPMLLAFDQAQSVVKRWIESLWFAPNKLKRFAEQDTLQGIYLPFWTFDAITVSQYEGERGEYYYTSEVVHKVVDGKAIQQTVQTKHTRWFPESGILDRWFDDVLVPAGMALKRNHLLGLGPWDLDKLKPYELAYLSGFKAERYSVLLEPAFEQAKMVIEAEIRRDVESAIGGDEQRIHDIRTAHSAITFKHILLPIWAGAYRFQGKVYQVAVNGRNGIVRGDRPYSAWKIGFAVLLAILAIGLFLQLSESSKKAGFSSRPRYTIE